MMHFLRAWLRKCDFKDRNHLRDQLCGTTEYSTINYTMYKLCKPLPRNCETNINSAYEHTFQQEMPTSTTLLTFTLPKF